MHAYRRQMQPWPGLVEYAQSIDLPVSGLRLYLYATGDANAPHALLLHGLGDEADTWRHLIEPLAVRWRVIAPDLPGFGRSEKPKRAYTVPFFCKAIVELMDVLSIANAVLVGNSMGGMIAQVIALEYPKRVKGLVLVDGMLLTRAQRLRLETVLFLIPGLGEWLYTRLRVNPQAAFDTLRSYYANLDELPEADREFLYQRVNERVWSDDQRRAYLSTLHYVASYVSRQQRGLEDRIAQLDIPTLIAWGERDQMIPVENAHALAEIQGTAKLVVFPDAGHLPQQERPQELLEAILADERLDTGG